jgi:hypothetical protein
VLVGEVGEARVVATPGVQPVAPSTRPGLERVLVADRANRDPTRDQLLASSREVGGHEVQVVQPTRRAGSDELHRARRAGRSELHHPEFGRRTVVDVEVEAGLLGIEGERTVDVGDWERDNLELEHQVPTGRGRIAIPRPRSNRRRRVVPTP